MLEGVKFNVKYLGSEIVDMDCGEEETTNAIKTILDRAKDKNKKLVRVIVNISERGVMVTSANKELDLSFQIHRFVDILKTTFYRALSAYPIAWLTQHTIMCLPSSQRPPTMNWSATRSCVQRGRWQR